MLAVFPCYIFWDLKLKPIIKFSLMILTSLGFVYVPPPLPTLNY